MQLKNLDKKRNGRGFMSMTPESVFLNERTKRGAHWEDKWNATIDKLELYLTKGQYKFTDANFLNQVAGWFGNEEAGVPENLSRWLKERDKLCVTADNFKKMVDKNTYDDMQKVFYIDRVRKLDALDHDNEISRYAVDTFMLSKVFKVVVNNYDGLTKVLKDAVKEDLIDPVVIKAIEELGIQITEKEEKPKLNLVMDEPVEPRSRNTSAGFKSGFTKASEPKKSAFQKYYDEEDEAYYGSGFGYGGGSSFGGSGFGGGFGSSYSDYDDSPFGGGSSGGSTFGSSFGGGSKKQSGFSFSGGGSSGGSSSGFSFGKSSGTFSTPNGNGKTGGFNFGTSAFSNSSGGKQWEKSPMFGRM